MMVTFCTQCLCRIAKVFLREQWVGVLDDGVHMWGTGSGYLLDDGVHV